MAPILGEISGLVCDLEAKTSQNYCFLDTNAQIGSVRSCSNGLKFGMNIGLYMGHKKGVYWGPKSRLRSSPVVFRIFEHQGVHLDNNGIYQTVAKVLLNP